MKKVKSITIIFSVVIVLILNACDKRKDYFSKFNTEPQLSIRKVSLGGDFYSSLNDSLWIFNNTYIIDYKLNDQKNDTVTLTHKIIQGNGNVNFNSSLKNIQISNLPLGKSVFEIIATDKYNSSSKCNIELFVIPNRNPFSKLSVIQTNTNSNHEIKISTNLSGDNDIKYGDFISEYQFKVSPTYTVNTPLNSINYIGATGGSVKIYLKVKDSKGAFSNVDSTTFNIL